MSALRILVIAVMALQAGACDEGISAGVDVDNRTSRDLHFRVQLEGPDWYSPPGAVGSHEIGLVIPAAVMPSSGCSAGAMVALDEADREVARHAAPVCIGETWIID